MREEQEDPTKWWITIILIIIIGISIVSATFYLDLHSDYSNLESQFNILKSENSNLLMQTSTLDSLKSNLEAQLTALQSDKSDLESQLTKLDSEKSTLQSQISNWETDYNNLNNSHNDLRTQYQLLETTYREKDSDCNILNGTLQTIEASCEEMEIRIAELESIVDYEIISLTGRDYYYSIIDGFQNANETIFVAMYSMIYDPDDSVDWANDLFRELVYASQRGVDVSVLIEYETYFDTMYGNREAFYYLQANNVNVKLDYNGTTTEHMKLVIIDEEIMYIGSHNWSESALYYNTETSVKIVNEIIAGNLRQYILDKTGF